MHPWAYWCAHAFTARSRISLRLQQNCCCPKEFFGSMVYNEKKENTRVKKAKESKEKKREETYYLDKLQLYNHLDHGMQQNVVQDRTLVQHKVDKLKNKNQKKIKALMLNTGKDLLSYERKLYQRPPAFKLYNTFFQKLMQFLHVV